LQDVLSNDEPVPLVGKRKGSDDDDPIFATGTETGTRDENQNENRNEDGTRIDPEVQEEESGPASLVFNQAQFGDVDKTPSRLSMVHGASRSTLGDQAPPRCYVDCCNSHAILLEIQSVISCR
jgi:hypothetical protein